VKVARKTLPIRSKAQRRQRWDLCQTMYSFTKLCIPSPDSWHVLEDINPGNKIEINA